MSKKDIERKLVDVDHDIVKKRQHIQKLKDVKDSKIPFFEKIPKDSMFYKHYM
jgi:hypothetical protein